MVLSQLMLAGFVAYWLTSQYRDERKMLGEDIARYYEESRSQVIDSLVFSRVVEPALQDSVTITMMAAKPSASPSNRPFLKEERESYMVKCDTIRSGNLTVQVPDSLVKGRGKAMGYAFSTNGQDVLIRSVKLFISHTGDTAKGESHITSILAGQPDTALFKKFFTEKVDGRHAGLHIRWMHDPPDTLQEKTDAGTPKMVRKKIRLNDMLVPTPSGRIRISGVYPDDLPGVEIRHDLPYLVKRIIPQITFALILLVLTGSAFWFTNRSLKRQLMLNDLRNDFVSNITHELKTPVSTVKVAIEALKTFDKVHNPEITQEYLDMAGHEMNRLDQLIGKVLDQSLIGDQQDIVQPQLTDIRKLIGNVLARIQPRLAARHADVTVEGEASASLMADPLHVEGVLINLIDNSLKYVQGEPKIRVELKEDHDYLIVEVSDNGPGIPKEYLGRVFDKFFRVPQGDTHTIKGYGLGLSFAALVMKQHGGSISVRNRPEGGCTFTLRFPRTLE